MPYLFLFAKLHKQQKLCQVFKCNRTQIYFTLDIVLCLCFHEDKNKKKRSFVQFTKSLFILVRVDLLPRFAKGRFVGCGENRNSPRFLVLFRNRKRTSKAQFFLHFHKKHYEKKFICIFRRKKCRA